MDPQPIAESKLARNKSQLAFTVLLVLGLMVIAWRPAPAAAGDNSAQVIHIDARSFAFEPEIVRVKEGDRVVLELESLDATHGIYLDGYELSMEAEPGHPARLEFTADKVGSFRFRCSVACGNLHPFMIGQLKVGPNRPFQWSILALGGISLVAIWWFGRRHVQAE